MKMINTEKQVQNTIELALSDAQVRYAFYNLLGRLSVSGNTDKKLATKIKDATLEAIRNAN